MPASLTRSVAPAALAVLVLTVAAPGLAAAPPAAATPAASAAPAAAPAPATKEEASYAVGLTFSTQWRDGGLAPGLAEDALIRGIHDGLGGKTPTADERARAGAFLKAAYGALGERNKAAAQAFLAKNGQAPGMQTTASGLQYLVLTPGDPAGPTAGANDHVTVQYRGQLLDGTEFDSSYARGKPAVLRPSAVIAGWREALALMSRGAKWRIFVPPELGYGTSPPPVIPTNSLLVFEIEVLGIEAAGGSTAGAPPAAH